LKASNFSVAAWIKIPKNAPGGAARQIFADYAGVPTYGMYVDLNNKAVAGFRPGVAITGTSNDPLVGAVSATSMNDGQWHHLVGVRTGATTASIYVDGKLDGTATNPAVLGVNGGSVDTGVHGCLYARIGAIHTSTGHCTSPTANPAEPHFPGVIDEVMIFDRALSPGEIQGIYAAGSAGICKPTKPMGMTWRWETINPIEGTVEVGCGVSNPNPCNGYVGDQLCTTSLPLLCFKPFTPLLPVPKSVNDTDYYNRWSGGIVGTTGPVQASSFNGSLAQANARCVQEFGATWRVAEFHDGASGAGGWNFQAYGNVGNPASRFWVHINDQPNGTCWPKP
jgi:hypothetical protein